MRKFFVACISFCQFLWSDFTTIENHPSTLIEGCVSAITGDSYLDENDIVVQGAEPISIRRTLISNKGHGLWRYFYHLIATREKDAYRVNETNGTSIVYSYDKHTGRYLPDFKKTQKGVTNAAKGILSGLTNLKNQYLTKKDDELTVHGSDGRKRYYKREDELYLPDISLGSEIHQGRGYILHSEQLPNGNWIFYEWEKGRPSKIRSTDSTGKITFAWVKIQNHHFLKDEGDQVSLKNPNFDIETSDGKKLSYHFTKFEQIIHRRDPYRIKQYWQLTDIESSFYPHETLQYKVAPRRSYLTDIIFKKGRHLQFSYYKKGDNEVAESTIKLEDIDHPVRRRVKAIFAPVGSDSTLYPIHQFKYDTEKRFTEDIDIEGNITKYEWDEDERLTAIKRYKNNQRFSEERFIWGSIDGPNHFNLKCKIFKDLTHESNSYAVRYWYDKYGNIKQERIYGNLTGHSAPITLDSKDRYPKSSETYTKKYEYTSDDRHLLIKKEEQNGLTVLYDYLPDTNLLMSEITSDQKKILHRKFFEYNKYGTLSREIIDDGSSLKKDDLTNVHTRMIKNIIPYDEGKCIGMPHIIEEKYWDGSREVLLKKTELSYKTPGKISQKDIFDAMNTHCYSLTYKYNDFGHLIEETNPEGQVSKSDYDDFGNKISFKDFGKRFSQSLSYDCSNRLNKLTEKGDDGLVHTTLHSYDKKNNLKKTTDYLGNNTKYVYDPFGNLIETQQPSLTDTKGKKLPCITKADYDALSRKISETDSRGHITSTTYNAYHKPIHIHHPDGTEERFTYDHTGNLKVHINQEGTETHYAYDLLNRLLSKTIVSKNHVLSEEIYTYQGLQLRNYKDPDGYTTTYTYDGAGRKIAEEKENERIEYTYDSLGRLSSIQKGDLVTIKEYDLLDHVIEEREENLNKEILTKTCTAYDNAGNIQSITRFVHNKPCEEFYVYDSLNRLIQKIDSLGYATRIDYEENNSLTQKTTDPKGQQTFEVFDPQGNLIKKTVIDAFGQKLSEENMFYDSAGNLAQQNSKVSGETITTIWEYDSQNRLSCLHEAYSTSQQRTTRYDYSPLGLLKHLYKPDGIVLKFTYDPLGRKIKEVSSDQSIHNTFEYTVGNVLKEAKDHVNRTTTTREIDPFGRILSERLGNGLHLVSTYDIHGRKTSLTLPDKSSIEYIYDSRFLREVRRHNKKGEISYTHQFLSYDLAGNLIEEKASEISIFHKYDRLGRNLSVKSKFFKQSILEFDEIGNVIQLSTQNQTSTFQYDSLYHLTSEKNHTYTYDSHSSRIEKDGTPLPVDHLHQHTNLHYDQNGNLFKNQNITYTYDALGHLLSAESQHFKAHYLYDPLHRRIQKTAFTKNGNSWVLQSQVKYLYDDFNEIGGVTPQGDIEQFRILGHVQACETGSSLAIELDHQCYIPFHDLFGNLTLLTHNGHTVEETFYSAFGEEKNTTTLSKPNPWHFASKRLDSETGLILFGRRYYDPTLGQWLTPDPAGFTSGLNLYLFLQNNPFRYTDLYGYEAELSNTPKPTNYQFDPFDALNPPPSFSPPSIPHDPCTHLLLEKGPSQDQIGIGYTNGIRTSLPKALSSTDLVSKWAGNRSVYLAYNSTEGFWKDIQESKKGLRYEFVPPMSQIIQVWDEFFHRNPKGQFLQVCTSQGAINVRNSLKLYPSELRSRITVLAISPAAYIDPKLCRSVLHLISERDKYVKTIFSTFDGNKELMNRNNPHVIWIPAHPKASRHFDHGFDSPTFEAVARDYVSTFIKNNKRS